jgi:ribosomal-protein-serine acetyltransferase
MTTLRSLAPTDGPAIFAGVDCSREAFRRWLVWYHDGYSLADAEAWLQRSLTEQGAGTGFHFAICREDGTLVGVTSLEDVSESAGRAMLGYWVATPATGRGAATRAVGQVLAWARVHTAIRIVWALVAEGNARSRGVLEANGFHVAASREGPAESDAELVYEIELKSDLAA